MLNLGFEHLAPKKPVAKQPAITLGALYLEATQLTMMADKLGQLGSAVENLITIRRTIKKYGFTKSVEALIGREQAMKASVEGIKEMWNRFVLWLKQMWNRFRGFISKLFGSAEGMAKRLEAASKLIDSWQTNESKEVEVPDWFGNFSPKAIEDAVTQITNTAAGNSNFADAKANVDKLMAGTNSKNTAKFKDSKDGIKKRCDECATALKAIKKLQDKVKEVEADVKKVVSAMPSDNEEQKKLQTDKTAEFKNFTETVANLAKVTLKYAGILLKLAPVGKKD